MTTPNLLARHGFSLRAGGVSVGAYAGLNLDDREDDTAAVAENRERLAGALGLFRVAGLAAEAGTRPGRDAGRVPASRPPTPR